MSPSLEALSHHWAVAVFVAVILLVCVLMLAVSAVTGGRTRGRAKTDPFESGIVSVGSAHLRLPAKFYLVAMFFVIFDVEALFLYAWAVSLRESGWIVSERKLFTPSATTRMASMSRPESVSSSTQRAGSSTDI